MCVAVFYIESCVKLWRKGRRGQSSIDNNSRVGLSESYQDPSQWFGSDRQELHLHTHSRHFRTFFMKGWLRQVTRKHYFLRSVRSGGRDTEQQQGCGGEVSLKCSSLSCLLSFEGNGQLRKAGGQTSHIPNNSCIANKEELPCNVCVCEGKVHLTDANSVITHPHVAKTCMVRYLRTLCSKMRYRPQFKQLSY